MHIGLLHIAVLIPTLGFIVASFGIIDTLVKFLFLVPYRSD